MAPLGGCWQRRALMVGRRQPECFSQTASGAGAGKSNARKHSAQLPASLPAATHFCLAPPALLLRSFPPFFRVCLRGRRRRVLLVCAGARKAGEGGGAEHSRSRARSEGTEGCTGPPHCRKLHWPPPALLFRPPPTCTLPSLLPSLSAAHLRPPPRPAPPPPPAEGDKEGAKGEVGPASRSIRPSEGGRVGSCCEAALHHNL